MRFEWDPAKNEKNQKKHGIAFAEAATVFGDPLADTFSDPDHSVGEFRYVTVGQSAVGRLLVVGHTERGDRIRIFTAGEVTSHERRYYENTNR